MSTRSLIQIALAALAVSSAVGQNLHSFQNALAGLDGEYSDAAGGFSRIAAYNYNVEFNAIDQASLTLTVRAFDTPLPATFEVRVFTLPTALPQAIAEVTQPANYSQVPLNIALPPETLPVEGAGTIEVAIVPSAPGGFDVRFSQLELIADPRPDSATFRVALDKLEGTYTPEAAHRQEAFRLNTSFALIESARLTVQLTAPDILLPVEAGLQAFIGPVDAPQIIQSVTIRGVETLELDVPAHALYLLESFSEVGMAVFSDPCCVEVIDVTLDISGFTACTGDLDGDGAIGLSDLALLLADFGCTSNCAADIQGDGVVDLNDLSLLLADFGCIVDR